MEFLEFANEIAAFIKERGNYETRIGVVDKNDGIKLTGIILGDSQKVQPVIDLEDYYNKFLRGTPMEILADYIEKFYETIRYDENMEFFEDYGKVENRIYIRLINYEKNEELLMRVPHIRWHDLAAVFYYPMEWTEERVTILLYENHLKLWGKTVEEIFQTAKRNMERDIPVRLITLEEIVHEVTGKEHQEERPSIYVLTIPGNQDGAAAILYASEIKELADKLQSDLLLFPSSIHEFLIVEDNHERTYEYDRMTVHLVNEREVYFQEFLSESLYRYNREKDEIEIILE
ncbi:MAG: hypothetical protein K2K56_04400 [Lachnospiraceae bacterium]|nr:hypothetical protein [Lachnospiraceae bacterium]